MSIPILCLCHDICNVFGMTAAAQGGDNATGLRERKKQQTRRAISNTATALFAEKGFEQTTIAEVAIAADVAKMTVTNYFPLKEDLVFDRAGTITGMLSGAATGRPAGQSVLDAIRAAYSAALDERHPTLGFIGRGFADLVESSPALRARERVLFTEQEAELADALAAEFATSPADVRLRIAAAELSAVFRILYYEGRRRLVAGEETAEIVRALRRAAKISFATVEHGLPEQLTTS
jgi:AcrR family transcriptional regulator